MNTNTQTANAIDQALAMNLGISVEDLLKHREEAILAEDPFKKNIEEALSYKDNGTFFELLSERLNICVDNRGILYELDNGLPTEVEIIDVKDAFIKCIKELELGTEVQVTACNLILNTLKNSNGKAYIKTVKTDIHTDSRNSIQREYRNGTLTINKNEIQWSDRDNTRVAWNYINRDYTPYTEEGVCDLEKLAKAFCTPNGKDPLKDYDKTSYRNYRMMLGASVHRYYDTSQPFAITLLDARQDSSHGDSAKGGRGKGLTAQIIKNSVPSQSYLTTEFKKTDHFQWQNVSKNTQTILVDEVNAKDIKALYSIITEPITVNQKNKQAYEISGAGKPRLIITSNYVVGSDVSTQRRLLRFSFTDH